MKLNRTERLGIAHRPLRLAVAVGLCATLLPLPMAPPPQISPDKDSSEAYPCQHRPCGCQSAAQCWKKCCCFTNTQKVAWARAHHIAVPEFVLAAAKQEARHQSAPEVCSLPNSVLDTSSAITTPGRCSRCRTKFELAKSSPCAESATSRVTKPHSRSSRTRKEVPPTDYHGKSARGKWVMALIAAECQGQGTLSFCFPVSILSARLALVIRSTAVIETVRCESERLQPSSLRPPLPPPKVA